MFELFPNSKIPLTFDSSPSVELYYRAGETEKANALVNVLVKNSFDMLEYYISLPNKFANTVQNDQNREMSHIRNMVYLTNQYKQEDLNKEINEKLQALINRLQSEIDS